MKEEKKQKRLKFKVYDNDKIMNASVYELELSQRSRNCLMRAQLTTIGEVVNAIEKEEDLLSFRNLGEKSAKEIMQKIFEYQFQMLSDEQQVRYLLMLIDLNQEGK